MTAPIGCCIEGCDRRAVARRLCDPHWKAAALRGVLDQYPKVRTGRRYMSIGYIAVWEPEHPLAMADGYVLEHRKVLYDAGARVPADAHVHHINGDKTDNRIENLEVKTASEHHREHIQEQGYVRNKYGTFPLASSDEERHQRQMDNKRRYRARLAARERGVNE